MLFLLKQAWCFYRLATEELSEAKYKDKVNALGIMGSTLIIDIIADYQNEPYFRAEDFKEAIKEFSKRFVRLDNILRILEARGINYATIAKLMTYLVEGLLEYDNELWGHGYLIIEGLSSLISTELINKVKHKIIMKMARGLNQEDNKEQHILALETFRDLYERSTLIPKDFLIAIAKKMGLHVYFEAMTSIGMESLDLDSLLKEHHQWDIWKVALLYNYYVEKAIDLSVNIIKQIINESDSEAKEYMRRWLYAGSDHLPFMLDEDMQPMSKYYIHRNWPQGYLSIHHNYNKDWQRIFEEFHVIPA